MSKRFALILFLAVTFTLTIVMWWPASRWVAFGLLRNQRFHEWKPTSYWIDMLEDKSVRERAFEVLRHIGAPAGQDLLCELGQHYAREGGETKPPIITERLMDFVGVKRHERPTNFNEPLMEAIRRIGQQAGPVYVQAATDKSPSLRRAAMEALGLIGRKFPNSITALRQGLNDEDCDVQRAAIMSIGKIGRKGKAAVPDLIETLPHLPQENVDFALTALVSMGRGGRAAVPLFVPMLDDSDLERRVGAAFCLAKIGGLTPETLPRICALLGDRTLKDRRILGDILTNLKPDHPVVIPTLVRALKDPDLSNDAMTAFSNFGSQNKEAVPALTELLRDTDPHARRVAASVLANFGPDAGASLVSLRELLNDEDVSVRLAAAEALWKINQDAEAVVAIREMLKNEDENVRLGAASALWNIDKDGEVVVATIVKILEELDINPPVLFREADNPTHVEGVNAPVSSRSRLIEICAWLIARVGEEALAAEPWLLKVRFDSYPGGKKAIFRAIGAIGPKATKSIPVLLDAVAKQNNFHAALALWKITGDTKWAILSLVHAIEEGSTTRVAADKLRMYQTRDCSPVMDRSAEMDRIIRVQDDHREALACLAEMGRHGREAVPAVTKELQEAKTLYNRFHAAETLVKLGEVSDELFMFLAEIVEEEEAGVYVYTACSLLADMESRASDAIPVLMALLKDDDERIVKAAAAALKRIKCRSQRR